MARNKSNNKAVMSSRNKTTMQGAGTARCIARTSKLIGLAPHDATGSSFTVVPMDGLNGNVYTLPLTRIAGAYEYYKIRSLSVRFVPAGGSTLTGVMKVAFINNPDMAVAAYTGSLTTRQSILDSEQGMTAFASSMGGTKRYDTSRLTSRKMYQTNYTLLGTADDFDRSIQTTMLLQSVGAASTQVSVLVYIDAVFEFSGLGRAADFTFQTLSTFTVNYDGEDEKWPEDVVLRARSGKYKRFITVEPPVPDKPEPEP